MSFRPFAVFILIVAVSSGAGCSGDSSSGKEEILVSAAVSLKNAFEEIGTLYEERTGVRVRFNFGASGLLQRQIESGAPVDVFASAAEKHMDELQARGLIVEGTRRDFAGNRLVLAVAAGSNPGLRSFTDLSRPDIARIAVGNPKTVPAGSYAMESLQNLGVWETLKPRLIFAENARQVLDYVVRNEVEAGFIYASDAVIASGNIEIAAAAPDGTHSPITYPVAVVQVTDNFPASRGFIELVLSAAGQGILEQHGFTGAPTP